MSLSPDSSCRRLAVICVLWKGDFRGRGYDEGWVVKLRRMVERNLSLPHTFLCLTNSTNPSPLQEAGIGVVPLVSNLPGWWAKLELFRPRVLSLADRFLYLDLDTLVVKDLRPIAEYNSKFAIRSNFNRPKVTWIPDNRGVVTRYNSSVMVYDSCSKSVQEAWSGFDCIGCMKAFRGDQDYLGFRCPYLDLLPPEWIKKIKQLPNKRPDGKVKVVLSMPHKNDKAAKRYRWARAVWR